MITICLAAVSLAGTSCIPGQLFGPTATATLPPTATATPPPTFTPTPEFPTFSADTGLEIVSVSEITGDGDISFSVGSDPNILKIYLNGKVPVTDPEAICWFCLDVIKIAPGLEIPVEFFSVLKPDEDAKVMGGSLEKHWKIVTVNGIRVMKDPPEIESLVYHLLLLNYPQMETGMEKIVAGGDGVTLKKDGKLFFLLKGSAYLEE
jgi:hypothetical protein